MCVVGVVDGLGGMVISTPARVIIRRLAITMLSVMIISEIVTRGPYGHSKDRFILPD